jgi:hypothetical protein
VVYGHVFKKAVLLRERETLTSEWRGGWLMGVGRVGGCQVAWACKNRDLSARFLCLSDFIYLFLKLFI